jgi:hypothetical protein
MVHRRCGCVLVLALLFACGAPSGPLVSPTEPLESVVAALESRGPELRSRCHRHDDDEAACEADLACVPGPPLASCDGRICTAGGPPSCVACLDGARLAAGPIQREVCALRATARVEEANRLIEEMRLLGTN